MHIADKLLILLSTYMGFRHVLAWRQTEKLSFYDKINTHTYYQNFTLKTNNNQIINFFDSIDIGKEAVIKSKSFFEGVENAPAKIKKIVKLLNASNIHTLDNYKDKVNIKLLEDTECECGTCTLERLNFFRASLLAKDASMSSNCWDALSQGCILFELGKYQEALDKLANLPESLISTKEFVPAFIANYNLEVLRRHVADEKSVNLYYELLKLPINSENREILKSISERTLLNDYLRTIDDFYLKIKDFKQRYNNTSTLDYLNRQRVKLIECLGFFAGNRILLADEFLVMCEKHMECCIISYSMQAKYRNHLSSFDDFIVKIALLYCEPINLLGYLQRNNVDSIKYAQGPHGYLDDALNNFFSDENVSFLKSEIIYIDNRTSNPELRRKTIKIFNNICILLCYVEINIESYIPRIMHFISELDFGLDDISNLAHPLLRKSGQFTTDEIYGLIRIILSKNDSDGYILANCLFCLEEKKAILRDSQADLANNIISIATENPGYATLRPLINIFNETQIGILKKTVNETLRNNFDQTLYYESVRAKCIDDPIIFFEQYCLDVEKAILRGNITFSENNSAFTGINRHLLEKINHFIECVYLLEKKELFETELVKKICSWSDYSNFLLNIDGFRDGDIFDINWLIDISSATIFRRMNDNIYLKRKIISQIPTTNNKYLFQIYFKYFVLA